MIAFVHGLRNWGAVEEYVAALVRGLRERGEDVALLYPDDAVLAPFAELGVAGGTFDLDAPGLTRRLRGELRRLRPRSSTRPTSSRRRSSPRGSRERGVCSSRTTRPSSHAATTSRAAPGSGSAG